MTAPTRIVPAIDNRIEQPSQARIKQRAPVPSSFAMRSIGQVELRLNSRLDLVFYFKTRLGKGMADAWCDCR
jgi:hypothetical protein